MNKKRGKLRLRKQVIVILPIVLLLLVLTIGTILSKNGNLYNEVSKPQTLSSKSSTSSINLSDLEYIKELEKSIEQRKKDNTVIYYAGLFKLNKEETLRIVHHYTNNYEDENYKNHNVIGPPNIINSVGSFDSFEAGVVYFIRDVYRSPEKYDSSIEVIRTSMEPTTKTVSSDGNIYMNNGATFEEYVGKISDLYNIDKKLVLAISYHEAGVKTSGIFKTKNNIGGHKGYYGWMSFTTLEAGVISHVLSVKSIASRSGVDISEATPEEIAILSGIYVNGNVASPSPGWTEKVIYFMEEIEQKDLFN